MFERAHIAVIQNDNDQSGGISVFVKPDGQDTWFDCLNLPGVKMTAEFYTIFAAHTGTGKSNSHTLHSINYYSDEAQINDVEEDSNKKDFTTEGVDLLDAYRPITS